ncbi:hypothetical protein [Luteimonas deserti]|uniref:DUF3618 domain-containing protein n=1 Tax=Luteimonas deserti TaxID=2752306 RepID=A0A7Z0QNM2_9GAMM|nr:hypothetical protein [Luteimonas deserti]NYZ61929.1 hypothetical protein [Luteimonas deserti]
MTPSHDPSDTGRAPSGSDPAHTRPLEDQAASLANSATSEAQNKVESVRSAAADKLDSLVDSVEAAASKLERNDIGHMSDYVTELASSLGRLSSSMRDKSGDELLHEVTRLARDNPALFVTGSIAVGFGLARFAKASAPASAAPPKRDADASRAAAPGDRSGNGSSQTTHASAHPGAGATAPTDHTAAVSGHGPQSTAASMTATAVAPDALGSTTAPHPGLRA